MSSRTIVYKGMFLVKQLRQFYLDLQDTRVTVRHCHGALPVLHQHQSQLGSGPIPTASSSTTARSTPFRATPTGCWPGRRPWRLACSPTDDLGKVFPVVGASGSDSAMLDNTLEFLVMSGMELPKAVMITIPEPWVNNRRHEPEAEGFLPVLRHHDGALGRPRLHPVLRRRS